MILRTEDYIINVIKSGWLKRGTTFGVLCEHCVLHRVKENFTLLDRIIIFYSSQCCAIRKQTVEKKELF